MKSSKNYFKGIILILMSTIGFAFMGIFGKFAYAGGINVSTLLFIRFSIAALLLFGYAYARNEIPKMNLKTVSSLIILGGVCYTLSATFFFTSIKYIPVALTELILFTYPIIVAVLSFVVDRHKPGVRTWMSILVSFVGILLILGSSRDNVNLIGVLLAAGASLIYSIYVIVGNRVVNKIPSMVTSTFVTLFAAIVLFIKGTVIGDLSYVFATWTWWPILGLALFSTVLAIVTFFLGLELLGPTKACVLSMTEPLFTVLLTAVFLGERLTPYQLIGGGILLAGAFMAALPEKLEVENM